MTPVPSHSPILPCTQPITRFVFVFFVFVFVFVFVQSHSLYCCLFLTPSTDKILSHFVFWSSYHLHRKLLISPEIRAWHIWCILIKSEWLWVLQVWTKSTSCRLEASKDIIINIKWGIQWNKFDCHGNTVGRRDMVLVPLWTMVINYTNTQIHIHKYAYSNTNVHKYNACYCPLSSNRWPHQAHQLGQARIFHL